MKTFLILKLWAAVLKEKKKSADSDNIVFDAEITLALRITQNKYLPHIFVRFPPQRCLNHFSAQCKYI